MIKDLVKLVKVLESKVEPIVEAVEKADPTTEEYGDLLENFSASMQLISLINRTLADVSAAMKANKEEETKDESNN
jgi:hypothetical protein